MQFIISRDIPNGGVAHVVKYCGSSISIAFHIKSLAARLKLDECRLSGLVYPLVPLSGMRWEPFI